MKKKANLQTSLPQTCNESLETSKRAAARLSATILELARRSERTGISINDAEELIGDHKGHSISPRFAELVRKGLLKRVVTEVGTPTLRFPKGRPDYWTRFDEHTKRNVVIHWLPEFAPLVEDFRQEDEDLV